MLLISYIWGQFGKKLIVGLTMAAISVNNELSQSYQLIK
jgi:hypothetical protein